MKNDEREDYVTLLKGQKAAIESPKAVSSIDRDRVPNASALFIKHHYHAATAFYLSGRTSVKALGALFTDHASINVIIRAAIEAVLTFHYVFVSPSTRDKQDFRYWTWSLTGYQQRAKFPVTMERSKSIKRQDEKEVSEILKQLSNNPEFSNLSRKQKSKITEDGIWRMDSWSWIAQSMGLADSFAKTLYGYLSEYAHSGSSSIWQVGDATAEEDRELLTRTTFLHVRVMMALMIKAYTKVFPDVEAVLSANQELTRVIAENVFFGSHLDD